ncbi:methionyl-tRNA formyltransferase [Parasulfuritortus cantonensis]|uniref:Methionyl-tRNA formyltransferase n=1 Tax=Parasulfuritortus cantonensis TaxID=2528202 RepID=A0A4R1B826_9PROT|nr:methionyl-tRNA formyltransferase [Parasulfuritortus cantonensis]TCJ12918.1 methionyl-tRNA formyltransferase [Parasulfuritortus cantonensis]
MRLVFAGTPEFAARALAALIAAGHDIPLVLTQPDRPAGRGMKLRMSPVKELALRHGLAVAQPDSLKTEAARQVIADAAPEVMVVAAYGLILPQAVLDMPRLGCVNIHASLLPRWRGAAPIQRAIEAGDAETGITLMQMDKGLDTGAMLARHPLAIAPDDSAASLHDKLAELGAEAIVALLPGLAAVVAAPQDDALACYAAKIGKDEARLDWSLPAAVLDRRVRAFNPFPGAACQLGGEPLKIWRARPAPGGGRPGEILAVGPDALRVACGVGALDLLELQKAGGKRLPVAAFLAGNPLAPGQSLG